MKKEYKFMDISGYNNDVVILTDNIEYVKNKWLDVAESFIFEDVKIFNYNEIENGTACKINFSAKKRILKGIDCTRNIFEKTNKEMFDYFYNKIIDKNNIQELTSSKLFNKIFYGEYVTNTRFFNFKDSHYNLYGDVYLYFTGEYEDVNKIITFNSIKII